MFLLKSSSHKFTALVPIPQLPSMGARWLGSLTVIIADIYNHRLFCYAIMAPCKLAKCFLFMLTFFQGIRVLAAPASREVFDTSSHSTLQILGTSSDDFGITQYPPTTTVYVPVTSTKGVFLSVDMSSRTLLLMRGIGRQHCSRKRRSIISPAFSHAVRNSTRNSVYQRFLQWLGSSRAELYSLDSFESLLCEAFQLL